MVRSIAIPLIFHNPFGGVDESTASDSEQQIERISFSPTDEDGASVEIYAMGFGTTPLGPARIEVASLRTKPGLVRANQEIELVLELRNSGGEVSNSTFVMIGDSQVAVPRSIPVEQRL